MAEFRVGGAVRRRGRLALLVLDERLDEHLDGQDTFLRAELTLDPDGVRLRVRVHTFGDATVLSPTGDEPIPGDAWSGGLRLQPRRGMTPVPPDLARALTAARLPSDLRAGYERELRH